MRLFRELPSFKRAHPIDSVGKIVIEFCFKRDYSNGPGWRQLTIGVFRPTVDHISGFRRQYSIWLPFYREF